MTAISSAVGRLWVLWSCCKLTCNLILTFCCSSAGFSLISSYAWRYQPIYGWLSRSIVWRLSITTGSRLLLLALLTLMLSLSLDDSRITQGECLGRTRWSFLLDWTTYLYYFYKWLYTTSPRSHVLLECSTITWPCHVIQLLKFLCYLYLVFIVWLDICDQVFECMENFFLLRALITWYYKDYSNLIAIS